jgi:hypothetical protein
MIKREGMVDYHARVRINRTDAKYQNEKLNLAIDVNNLSGHQIAGIRFSMRAFDVFGEIIPVEGEESHVFSIRCAPFEPAMRIVLNYSCDIGNIPIQIDITYEEVHYSDGTVEKKERPHKKLYYYQELEPDHWRDQEGFQLLRKNFHHAICYAEKRNDGWLCTCGRLNRNRDDVCPECLEGRKKVLTAGTREAVKKQAKSERDELVKNKPHGFFFRRG